MQPNNSTDNAVFHHPHQPIKSGRIDYFNDPSSPRPSTALKAWQAATGADMDLPAEIIDLLGGGR